MHTNGMTERHEEFRKRLVKCSNPQEDVMKIYHGITSNECRPILMDQAEINRLLTMHGGNGFVVVSAYRENMSHEENVKYTKELMCKVATSDRSYLPVYGGHRSAETGEVDDYVPSLVVFNHNKKGEPLDEEELEKLAMQWRNDYEQERVRVKLPGRCSTPSHPEGEADKDGCADELGNIEWYCNPIPCTLNEMQRRTATHEIMVWL